MGMLTGARVNRMFRITVPDHVCPRRPWGRLRLLLPLTLFCCTASLVALADDSPMPPRVFPGVAWQWQTPARMGLDPSGLAEAAAFAKGRGCVVRGGYMVFTWGDFSSRGDVASACKPVIGHMTFKAVELGRLATLDTLVADYEPRLRVLNPGLGYKDARITFRHLITQTSCYGVLERPGEAFCYNDHAMALLCDTLFLKVYAVAYEDVDERVLQPLLTGPLQCEDHPTLLAFGVHDRLARLSISPRDFARFGWLYLNDGQWRDQQLLSAAYVRLAVGSPLPLSLPRTRGWAAPMIPGQRSHGSGRVPSDQCDHDGSYSYLWWVNGIDREGERFWPQVPPDAYAALGHINECGMAVIPSLDMVVCWDDTTLQEKPARPRPEGILLSLVASAATAPPDVQPAPATEAAPDQR